MEFHDVVKARYSCRSYADKPIERDKLDRVLEAAGLAPSGNNRQPWKFVVVCDAKLRQEMIVACNNQPFVGQAPAIIVAVGLMPDRVMACQVPGDPVDLSIALEHIALAATAEGLGTCWIGSFDQDKVRELLGIPATAKVIEVMPIGYPTDKARPKTRKPMSEIVCYDGWNA